MLNQSPNPFEFLTAPWGSLPIGSGASLGSTPTGAFGSTVPELDKRIAELKTVEQWLTLNLNLLRTTIQGMEVQRGTLAAIESFSQSFSQPLQSGSSSQASAAAPGPGSEQAGWWWNAMQQQFGQMMQAAQAAGMASAQGPFGTSGSAEPDQASGGSSGYAASPISPEPAPKAEK